MIRNAEEHDFPSVRVLIQSVPGLWHEEWRSDVLEQACRASNGLAFVWEEDKKILGFSCAHDVGFLAYLSLLVVAETARGQGIATQLIRHTEQVLIERGCATLISDVWSDAVGFYQSLGWSPPAAVLLRHHLFATREL
jgi:GNAT superfamily N-acetyltransferase